MRTERTGRGLRRLRLDTTRFMADRSCGTSTEPVGTRGVTAGEGRFETGAVCARLTWRGRDKRESYYAIRDQRTIGLLALVTLAVDSFDAVDALDADRARLRVSRTGRLRVKILLTGLDMKTHRSRKRS